MTTKATQNRNTAASMHLHRNCVVCVTLLVDNTAGSRELLGEHGLAFWIQWDSDRILFDTGQGLTLCSNAHSLGAALAKTDAVVLSHGHYDHTGGLELVLQSAPHAKVYAHAAAFVPKYGRNDDGTSRNIGSPLTAEQVRQRAGAWIPTTALTEVCPGLFATGSIPRTTDYEDTSGPFFLDQSCQHCDPFVDDQAVFFETVRGTVVLLGCAHAGVINTLRYVRELTGGKAIHAVLGGMHLRSASQERIDQTVESLRQFDVVHMAPAHCTGMAALVKLWTVFPDRCLHCTVGTTMQFEGP